MTAPSKRVLVALSATALIAVGIAGCGGGGDDSPNAGGQQSARVDLSGVTIGFAAVGGRIEIEAGGSEDRGDIRFS